MIKTNGIIKGLPRNTKIISISNDKILAVYISRTVLNNTMLNIIFQVLIKSLNKLHTKSVYSLKKIL